MVEIIYTETDQSGLDAIQGLWLKLMEHHKVRSLHFSKYYDGMTFEMRKLALLEKAQKGAMRLDLATEADSGRLKGYCVSSVVARQGEIDSLYVEQDLRHSGIGDNLMKKALDWIDKQSVTRKVIEVGSGNEEVFEFYARYKFYPRRTVLEQTP